MLVVCTGNICRSPVAELLLQAQLGGGVTVRSAGTHALRGGPISTAMARLLDEADVASAGFVARQLSPPQLREAELVLTMTRQHRGAAVELAPGCVRRAFTLVEFARLLSEVSPASLTQGSTCERLRGAVPLAVAQRRQVNGPAEADDIDDPYGRSAAHYAAAFVQIHRAVDTIAGAVAPGAGGVNS